MGIGIGIYPVLAGELRSRRQNSESNRGRPARNAPQGANV
jgi:hypothetical protein